ncbi:MAG: hypothetical protein U0165_12410 [Polyangiaceae bacterium]
MSTYLRDEISLATSMLRQHKDGEEALERIDFLERAWGRRIELAQARWTDTSTPDFDVVLCGGGLWSILAPMLAQRGLRVAILDRGVVGRGHREWNISASELAPFVSSGLFTADELEGLILARYDHGVCRWHGGGTYPVRGVLDHAIDGEQFLDHSAKSHRRRRAHLRSSRDHCPSHEPAWRSRRSSKYAHSGKPRAHDEGGHRCDGRRKPSCGG